ncbi:MAG: YHS domain-containing protein [Actinomycetota bacterium]|jgi:Cu+-exporting ATPase
MYTDPVCGMTITVDAAAGAWEHDGTTYFFCSVVCLERFRQDPTAFLTKDPSGQSM